MVLWLHRRRAVGVERLDGLQAPGLALLALVLGPADRLPVGREDQPRAGIGDLDAVAARLVDIKKEGLLDRVLVRPGLDEDAVLQEDVGGAQNLLAAVERIGDVMEAALGAGVVARIGEVVGLVGHRHPDRGFGAVIENDGLGQPEAEIVLEEDPVGLDVDRQPVPVVEPAHIAAARRKALRLVLQRWLLVGRRLVPLGLVVKLDHVAVRILAHEGLAVAEIAVGPADVEARALQRRGAPLQRLRRARAIGDMAHARRLRRRQLERIALVVVPAAQIDGVALLAALRSCRARRRRISGSRRIWASAVRDGRDGRCRKFGLRS